MRALEIHALAIGTRERETLPIPLPEHHRARVRVETIVGSWMGKNRGRRDRIILASKKKNARIIDP